MADPNHREMIDGAPVVSSQHLRALVAVQRAILRRETSPPPLAGLGPLAGLYAGLRGWTPDGPALAVLLLSDAVDAWAAADSDRGVFSPTGYPREVKAAALRTFFGIGTHPGSAEDAVGIVDMADPPSRNSIFNWRAEWAKSTEAGEVAARHARPYRSDPSELEWPPPVWVGEKADWPPASGWPVPGDGINERKLLLDAARDRLVEAGVLDEAVDAVRDLHDQDVLAALREVGIRMVTRHFGPDHSQQLGRYFAAYVTAPWRGYPTPSDVSRGGHQGEVVAVAAQLHLHLAAHPSGRDQLAEQVRLMRDRAVLPERASRAFRRNLVTWTTATAVAPDRGVRDEVDVLYQLAGIIRSSPDLAAKFAADYLEQRERLELVLATETEVIRLAQADQSVSLDIARLGDTALLDRLDAAMAATSHQSPLGRIYRVLIDRDRGIVELKAGEEHRALGLVSRGFDHLEYILDAGMVDARTAMEVRHQLALAATGDFIRIAEGLLVAAGDERRRTRQEAFRAAVTRNAVSALGYSARTMTLLEEIDAAFGLPATRRDGHLDGRFSAATWQVRSRAMRVRALLVAVTAFDTGLATPHLAKSLVPGVPTPHVDHAVAAYLDLIARPEITAADTREVVSFAMWLALLNAGRIPVGFALAPALRRDDIIGLIDDVGDGMTVSTVRTRALDLPRIAEWLGLEHLGIAARVRVDGPVAAHFESSHNGYGPWRGGIPARVPGRFPVDRR